MTEEQKIPGVVLEAYYLLLQYRLVEITKPIEWDRNTNKKRWVFECKVKAPYPNPEDIPEEVPLEVVIPEVFPYVPIEFYPKLMEVSGFPHQDAETGKLCLPEERLAPANSKRLVHYVKWAIEWLHDAVNGNLLKPGDPYELPDFSRKLLPEQVPMNLPFLIGEDNKTFEKWMSYIGQYGTAECFICKDIPGIFSIRFRDYKKAVICELDLSSNIRLDNKLISGMWILLPDIRYIGHRPPLTFEEITELCSNHEIDFYDILKKAWKYDKNPSNLGVILIGFPIPQIHGANPIEIHWQPLVFPNVKAKIDNLKIGKRIKAHKKWVHLKKQGIFARSERLPWAKAENVSFERLFARGHHSDNLRHSQIALLGCGALGSLVAELLARGGVKSLYMFDPDILHMSNLCRHTLDGNHFGKSKARSLALRLSTTNPNSQIKGFCEAIPLDSFATQQAQEALTSAEILIDCTTSESAFEWLSEFAIVKEKKLVSMFFDFRATLLTLCISGIKESCKAIYQNLLKKIKSETLPVSSGQYFYEPSKEEQIIEGAGCWHPTFPALNAHIQLLACAAVETMNYHFENDKEKGLAVLIRRNSFLDQDSQTIPLIEVIWKQKYP